MDAQESTTTLKREEPDEATESAITEADLEGRPEDFSVYGWAAASVRIRNSEATTAVECLQANSKFFRSFFLVIILALALSLSGIELALSNRSWMERVILSAFWILALWRFFEIRLSATILLYQSYLQPSTDLTKTT